MSDDGKRPNKGGFGPWSNNLRVQVIQLEKGAPVRFQFCGTLPLSANFGALETENRAFC